MWAPGARHGAIPHSPASANLAAATLNPALFGDDTLGCADWGHLLQPGPRAEVPVLESSGHLLQPGPPAHARPWPS